MSSTTRVRLTPSQRLSRGLMYSTVGPIDVTRGAVGLGVESARSSAVWAGNKYRRSKMARQLKAELAAAQEAIAVEVAAAQEVVAGLPQALEKARRSRRRKRPLLLAGIAVVVLAGGAVTFSIVRRSTQPEPSPLPPSVEISPKP
ncbi:MULTISPECIES: cell wall synthesis protein CwsA [Mycolicibacterium]|uniref:Cell wall synthesis protein CwsA n=1 Tax=Mycolicibacterium vanbaalenii (strain DSM 7251 / JCM 13017 / BCRC 16820 / KCTC 9966 / NRRL B-24157 / PYR-1) TaxID=350058 RepID=A1T117_MYCVP|nr:MULTISPECIES: cell wall synthesis protein CwsA [Mycolicibacterium]ABM10867.1 putative membrane protein [Mycolicibacterium vanbaalenii PYR-1]MCV7129741.1 cell wall synthesis protein CwsA [Mycolicibacterium vanbaalenii PYR-1]MDW5609248.1 cell wall synthesis protein CwsA [Mycolicibacterium sp. D5.8-2]